MLFLSSLLTSTNIALSFSCYISATLAFSSLSKLNSFLPLLVASPRSESVFPLIHASLKYHLLQFISAHEFNITSWWHSSLYKIMASTVRWAGFKSVFCYLLAIGPWAYYFDYICLSFPIHKIRRWWYFKGFCES